MAKQNPDKLGKKKTAAESPAGNKPVGAGQPDAFPAQTHKLAIVITLLRRPEGASIDELAAATGWQPHSVRALISRAVKKKQVLAVTAEGVGRSRIYRVAG